MLPHCPRRTGLIRADHVGGEDSGEFARFSHARSDDNA
jgi:hypothetical protein